MASKPQQIPLAGFVGQSPETTLADGRTLSAGEVTDLAFGEYAENNRRLAALRGEPEPDEAKGREAWNALSDEIRNDWCSVTVHNLDNAITENSAQADLANALGTVGTTAEQQLGAALIDAALTEVKALAKPWQQMTADQQSDVLERITNQVRSAVGDAIRLLATRGGHHVVCELESITVKKGTKAALAIPKDAVDQDLVDAVGQKVILVVGAMAPVAAITQPKPDPNQGDLLAARDIGGGDNGLANQAEG